MTAVLYADASSTALSLVDSMLILFTSKWTWVRLSEEEDSAQFTRFLAAYSLSHGLAAGTELGHG
jgi:hypothetical protein